MKATRTAIKNSSRLKAQAAFDSLRKTKTRWVSKGFALQAILQEGATKPAFCVITSKKTAALATDRNRMRRRLRAVAFEILPEKAHKNMAYMLVARKDSLSLPMDDLRKDLIWCLKKLALLNEEEGNRP